MKKSIAFSMAELITALAVIGVLSLVLMANISSRQFDESAQLARIYQAIDAIEKASVEIMAKEKTKCPTGKFITKVAGKQEYSLYNASGSLATTADVAEIFSDQIGEEVINFCTYSNYCASSTTTIKGFKINKDLIIGFEVFNTTSKLDNCPTTYYVPKEKVEDSSTGKVYSEQVTKTAGSMGKCWGKLYIDVNPKETAVQGKNIFIYGMGEQGVVY